MKIFFNKKYRKDPTSYKFSFLYYYYYFFFIIIVYLD